MASPGGFSIVFTVVFFFTVHFPYAWQFDVVRFSRASILYNKLFDEAIIFPTKGESSERCSIRNPGRFSWLWHRTLLRLYRLYTGASFCVIGRRLIEVRPVLFGKPGNLYRFLAKKIDWNCCLDLAKSTQCPELKQFLSDIQPLPRNLWVGGSKKQSVPFRSPQVKTLVTTFYAGDVGAYFYSLNGNTNRFNVAI
jgi:hypothetical protein